MILGIPSDIFWAGLAGLIAIMIVVAGPLHARHRAARIAALRGGAAERYFQERRSLEAYSSDLETHWTPKLIRTALVTGLFVSGWTLLGWDLPDPLLPLATLALAGFGFAAALRNAWRIWRDAQPDPRHVVISPAHHNVAARTEGRTLLARIAGVVAIGALTLALASFSMRDLPDSIAYLKALL
ncbi:hypothetical protein [Sphingosinithalassobacter portus]|uniref:hypothetical protein n=1 Tax=Stakelama portus TaxID=2676234 RepID=UPI0011AB8C7C|nr:hypothetical protein [Sphingosinithalassobacter portus]